MISLTWENTVVSKVSTRLFVLILQALINTLWTVECLAMSCVGAYYPIYS